MSPSRSTSRATSRVRPVHRSHSSIESIPVATSQSVLLPEGIGEEAASVYEDLVHAPHHEQDETLIEESSEDAKHDEEFKHRQSWPWWKRPSYYWVVCSMPLAALVMSATVGPRVEIYTGIVCAVHKPDLFKEAYPTKEQYKLGFDPPDESLTLPSPSLPVISLNSTQSFTSHTIHLKDENQTPANSTLCAKDPVVGAQTAKLTAAVTTVMGILSCLTTAWWGSFSDRHGRVRLMGVAITGLLLTDLNFILVTFAFRRLPGGYWFLLVTSVIEGLVGGLPSSIAAFHAYQADTTTPINRNRVLSLTMGLFFIGMSAGPALGSLIIKLTGRTINVFYFASACHFGFALATWFIIPESLTKVRIHAARKKHQEVLEEEAERLKSANFKTRALLRLSGLFQFFTVLGDVFSPTPPAAASNPLKKKKRDWNLLFMAAAYGFVISIMGAYPYKFQFTASNFNWTSQNFGYWLSLVSLGRSFTLMVLLPLLIRIFKPKPALVEVRSESYESEPLLSGSDDPSSSKTETKEVYLPRFELHLTRIAMAVEAICYLFISLTLDPVVFTTLSVLSAVSAVFGPAMQTVALHLHVARTGSVVDTGKLFGAMSVIQALGSQIIGPALFGMVYAKSVVAGFPRAIFVVATIMVTVSFLLLLCVRIKSFDELEEVDEEEPLPSPSGNHVQEATLVDAGSASASGPSK